MFYTILSAQKNCHPKFFWVKQGATQCYQAFLVFEFCRQDCNPGRFTGLFIRSFILGGSVWISWSRSVDPETTHKPKFSTNLNKNDLASKTTKGCKIPKQIQICPFASVFFRGVLGHQSVPGCARLQTVDLWMRYMCPNVLVRSAGRTSVGPEGVWRFESRQQQARSTVVSTSDLLGRRIFSADSVSWFATILVHLHRDVVAWTARAVIWKFPPCETGLHVPFGTANRNWSSNVSPNIPPCGSNQRRWCFRFFLLCFNHSTIALFALEQFRREVFVIIYKTPVRIVLVEVFPGRSLPTDTRCTPDSKKHSNVSPSSYKENLCNTQGERDRWQSMTSSSSGLHDKALVNRKSNMSAAVVDHLHFFFFAKSGRKFRR